MVRPSHQGITTQGILGYILYALDYLFVRHCTIPHCTTVYVVLFVM